LIFSRDERDVEETMSHGKLTRRFLLIGLLGGAGLWAIRSPTSSTPQKKPLPCDNPNVRLERRDPEPPLVHVRWAIGRKDDLFILSIPMPFFKYPPSACYSGFRDPKDPKNWEKYAYQLFLKVRLSDFSPWMYLSRKEEKKYRLDDLEIKIDSTVGATDKLKLIQDRYEDYVKFNINQSELEYHRKGSPGDFSIGFKPDIYGLKHYGVIGDMDHFEKMEIWRGVGYRDVYYIEDEFGTKKMYIETLASQLDRNNEKNPDWDGDINVYHHFYNNRIDAVVRLAYTRRQLANWRTIQERVETWLNALPITPNRRLYDG
jgi:hypothetical protein